MKKTYDQVKLTKEEKNIEKERKEGKYAPIADFAEEKRRLMQAARLPAKKTRTITIRLPEATIVGIRKKAEEEGIPYQTLIGSILHKHVHLS
jgi:predicted DNA binding CopG/RHH family protein